MRRWIVLLLMAGFSVGCGSTANVELERETLMRLDREWAASVKDMDKFMSYYASDASLYPPGMPLATGSGPIRDVLTKMSSPPGFSLEFGPTKADVGASGDIGYTTGTYRASMSGTTEKGKYVAVWKKQSDGHWKVREDIFNPDSSGAAPTSHVMVETASIKWGNPPPSLPPGSKIAVIAGDPSKAGPFVLRAQVPAGYKVAPHWHPGDENLTVLSGTVALGMGDTWDESKMQTIRSGGYAALPAEMRHSFLAKTASTFQVHGMGPFVLNYVNPADDPSKK
jgi:ketosteroid isomerase-like protein/quercetin dioxygenase-like cupin family protein